MQKVTTDVAAPLTCDAGGMALAHLLGISLARGTTIGCCWVGGGSAGREETSKGTLKAAFRFQYMGIIGGGGGNVSGHCWHHDVRKASTEGYVCPILPTGIQEGTRPPYCAGKPTLVS